MTFLRSTIIHGFFWALLACGSDPASSDPGDEASEKSDDTADEDQGDSDGVGTRDAGGSTTSGTKDAGGSIPTPPKDAGGTKLTSDSGSTTPPRDAAAAQSGDAGKSADVAVAGQDGGGGLMFPDLFPPAADAGMSTTPPASGTRDVNGPCKDLQLVCFDIFDMFIFNPSDCFTCNGGKGCQGCAIPFAF